MLRAKESTECGNMMIMASSDFISNNFNGVTRTKTRLSLDEPQMSAKEEKASAYYFLKKVLCGIGRWHD